MTFSITGRCARTGQLGVAIATSSIAVGARCPHARAGVGAVATQNVTDPTFGPRILDRLASGAAAAAALAAALAESRGIEFRQVAVVDAGGRTALHTGGRILGRHAEAVGEGCVAAGNLLRSVAVPPTMTARFAQVADQPLPERLLLALEAGLDAGGEEGIVHSAALLVVDRHPFPLVDLRCDWDDATPILALRRLWAAYAPQALDYVTRAVRPEAAPSYGVAGDP